MDFKISRRERCGPCPIKCQPLDSSLFRVPTNLSARSGSADDDLDCINELENSLMKHFPPFVLDSEDASLLRDDVRIPLSPKAFAVLQHLVNRAGKLVTKADLLKAVWPQIFVHEGVLKVCILEIR